MFKLFLRFSLCVALTMFLWSTCTYGQQKVDLSMFPKANKGYKAVYIQLPKEKNENDLKVEIFAGLLTDVDCNKHFLMGTFSEKNVEGWGYSYYEVESNGAIGSTQMACPDRKTKKEFVYAQPLLTSYNSKLPLVVHIPEKLEVRYRVWRAEQTLRKAQTKK